MQTAAHDVFRALADPTRMAIVERLAGGEARVTDIAEPFDMSLNAVSKHVKVLERSGLVSRRVSGRTHRIRLETGAFDAARRWMDRQEAFWNERLAGLRAFLEEEQAAHAEPPPNEEETPR